MQKLNCDNWGAGITPKDIDHGTGLVKCAFCGTTFYLPEFRERASTKQQIVSGISMNMASIMSPRVIGPTTSTHALS